MQLDQTQQTMTIRIRASQIRRQLRNRHNSEVFLDILDNLSDEDLVRKMDDHHAVKVQAAREGVANANS